MNDPDARVPEATHADLRRRFGYHPPQDEVTVAAHEGARDVMYGAAEYASLVIEPSRELSLVITALEEAMMWLNAGIARQGADRAADGA
jgi:hypothetical protein